MDCKIIIIAVLIGGCVGPKVLQSERTIRDSVVFRMVEKEVPVPGAYGEGNRINIDSLVSMIRSGMDPSVIERTLIKEDPETGLKVGILIDSLGNLMAVCEMQEKIIKIMVEEREIIRSEFERIIIRERENIFKRIFKYVQTTLWVFGLAVLGYVGYRVFRAVSDSKNIG